MEKPCLFSWESKNGRFISDSIIGVFMTQASAERHDGRKDRGHFQDVQSLSAKTRILSLAKRDPETGAISGTALESFLDAATHPDQGRRKGLFTLSLVRHLHHSGDFEETRTQVKAISEALATTFSESRGHAIFALPTGMVALFMPDIPAEDALCEMEEFRNSLTGSNAFDISPFGVGLASFPGHGLQGSHLIRRAEEALCLSIEKRGAIRIARKERMVMKTAYYTRGQSARLTDLAERLGKTESILLREALEDICAKYEPSGGPVPGGLNRLREAFLEITQALVDQFDTARGEPGHSAAVSDLARALAREIDLDRETEVQAGAAGLLHDLARGPVPGCDNCEDGHCEAGARILTASRLLAHLSDAVAGHHGTENSASDSQVSLLLAFSEEFEGVLRKLVAGKIDPEEAIISAVREMGRGSFALKFSTENGMVKGLLSALERVMESGWRPTWLSGMKLS
ncbi:MAG: hypothetical protein CVV64_18185 [Candidatus Wallbacteria bacterium HGW-Wallbacteria-1]|jgi:putative nucleotidyltransferase with HDIG domain|uniref:HD domain-containing protein n=1 Tax=Candidatus Wallbacteria bacterium HGW-Wallbacteria-1 TaxID=2013854 RepID=A0A2N1PJS9_9BACT|nr:MAG: hypothetical protein CVV64_18185 [Candidatus Wallbacteria bacterium HGW-Wallbacteria-1]